MKKLVIFGLITLALSACFIPGDGGEGTFSVTIGDGNSRSIMSWARDNLGELSHTIKVKNNSGVFAEQKDVKDGTTVNFTVPVGTWEIAVEAYKDGELAFEGASTVTIKAGKNGSVSVKMGPSGERVFVMDDHYTQLYSFETLSEALLKLSDYETDPQYSPNWIISIGAKCGTQYLNNDTGGTINGKNITLTSYGGPATIQLDRGEDGYKGHMFNVSGSLNINEAGSLTIEGDITLKGIDDNDSALIFVSVSGNLTIKDNVKITGNNGGGVLVIAGTFTMNGGEISGNKALNGGGVYLDSVYYIEGGYIIGATFIMENGTISGNEVIGVDDNGKPNGAGGGVYIAQGGTYTMKGGEISGNIAVGAGGGVYVKEGAIGDSDIVKGTFTMKSGKISKNSSPYGGGVFISGGEFIMEDGEISGNKAENNGNGSAGGGVLVKNGIFKMMGSGAIISGNTANGGGGGVKVETDTSTTPQGPGTFIMYGGEISGNTGNGVTAEDGAEFRIVTGTIFGLNEGAKSNTPLAVWFFSNNMAEYGTFDIDGTWNGESLYTYFSSNNINDTIKVVNGVWQ